VRNLLADAATEAMRVCLVVDDAQQAPRQTLRSLKQLWEYEHGFRKCLGILLLGQLELIEAMRDVRLRETTNRCATFLMRGLVHPNQVKGYLGWKFQRAGADVDKVFDAEAIKAVAHHAKFEFQVNGEKVVAGPPLRVQNIAARLMNKADEIGEAKVTAEVVGLIAR
jgi:type II secretory pathway predicted ATPase ExeA